MKFYDENNYQFYYNFFSENDKNSIESNFNDLIEISKNFIDFANLIPKNNFFEKNIKNYLNLISEENNSTDSFYDNIEKEKNFFDNFSDNEKIIIFIIKNYTKKVKKFSENKFFDNNISQIVEIVINKTNYLLHSKNFFKIFFDNINPTNLNELNDFNFYFKKICLKLSENNLNSKILNKIISDIFNDNNEIFLEKFFEDENLILTKEIFQYFTNYIKEINNNKSNNKEIINLFYLSYIKVFLFKMSKIYTDKNLYNSINQTKIFDLNFIKDSNIIDYYLKCLNFV